MISADSYRCKSNMSRVCLWLFLLLCVAVSITHTGLVNIQRKKQRDAVYDKASEIISKKAKDEEDARNAEYARYMEQIKNEIQHVCTVILT